METNWFWAHDAQAHQLASLGVPGLGLVRLASYGQGTGRRFAALFRTGAARTFAARTFAVDVPGDQIPADAVAITGAGPRFTVVREAGRTSIVHFGDNQLGSSRPAGRVLDISSSTPTAAYLIATDPGPGGPPGQQVLTGLDERELKHALRRLDAQPALIRLGPDGSLTAVAEPGPRTWWAAGVDADEVAHELNRRDAYPLDLDAIRTADGVRFSVVIRQS